MRKSRKSLKVAGVFLLDCGLFLLSGACQALGQAGLSVTFRQKHE